MPNHLLKKFFLVIVKSTFGIPQTTRHDVTRYLQNIIMAKSTHGEAVGYITTYTTNIDKLDLDIL